MTNSKFKIEHSAGQKILVVQGQKGQQISEREYYAISNGHIPGLLRVELITKGNTFKLNYNISGFISLREFLLNPLDKKSFSKLLNNILNNLKALQTAYYNHQFILLDLNAAMVNPTTHQVSFVYVPITFYESGTSLKEFLLSIIQCCSFVPGENTDYVREYITILNRGINFSIFDLEEYIKRLNLGDATSNREKRCTRCGAFVQPNINFCSSCGMKISGVMLNNPQGVYNPMEKIAKPTQTPVDIVVDSGVNRLAKKHSDTISDSCVAIDVQQQYYQAPLVSRHVTVCMSRVKNGEQIRISSDSFRIGKEPNNCEYCIRDNSAISRCHVLIKRVNNSWFITDLNSTNKTYVNGQMIQPNTAVELYDGVNIRLANEDFIFNLY